MLFFEYSDYTIYANVYGYMYKLLY